MKYYRHPELTPDQTDMYIQKPVVIILLAAVAMLAGACNVSGIEERTEVAPDDRAAVFSIKLEKGPAKLQTWFYDRHGGELCGAYYVEVRRK